MLVSVVAFMLAQSPAPVIAVGDRIAPPSVSAQTRAESLSIRISSSDGVLWQGSVRVRPNQGASYNQNFSQASTESCGSNSYDHAERRQFNFNVNAQHNALGQAYRIDVSWQRPIADGTCSETGTRTVGVNRTVLLSPGQTSVIEGDAGLRIELTRGQ